MTSFKKNTGFSVGRRTVICNNQNIVFKVCRMKWFISDFYSAHHRWTEFLLIRWNIYVIGIKLSNTFVSHATGWNNDRNIGFCPEVDLSCTILFQNLLFQKLDYMLFQGALCNLYLDVCQVLIDNLLRHLMLEIILLSYML